MPRQEGPYQSVAVLAAAAAAARGTAPGPLTGCPRHLGDVDGDVRHALGDVDRGARHTLGEGDRDGAVSLRAAVFVAFSTEDASVTVVASVFPRSA